MKMFLKILTGNLVLRKGPQDFPFSMVLMKLCLMAYFITGLPGLMATASFEVAVFAMVLDTLVLLVFAYLCLQAFGKSARFVQTVIALASCGAVFQLIVLPLLYSLPAEPEVSEALFGISLMLLVFVSWNLAVYAHIFRESFNVRLASAMALTVCYIVMTVVVRKLLFPELE